MSRRSPRLLVAGSLTALLATMAAPAQAGLFGPLLSLARPQLESSLARQCLAISAGGDPELLQAMARPCEALARPIAACLISQTEASGRTFGVISELVAGRFGDASELVVKRCLALTFGLPSETFAGVPLRRLAEVHGLRIGSLLSRPPLPTVSPAPAGRVTPVTPGGSTATMQPPKSEAP